MVSALISSGLSKAEIATLFGGGAASSQETSAKAGTTASSTAKTAAGAITGASLIGSGSDAAKAIQTIVTQIQVEKMQSNLQGKISTLDYESASTTIAGTALVGPERRTANISTTKLDLATSATSTDLQGAVDTLTAKVKSEEAEVEAAQDGVLMTKDNIVYGGNLSSMTTTWTSNSVSLNMQAVENQGVELSHQETALSSIPYLTALAQTMLAPLSTDVSSPDPNANAGTHSPALFLEIDKYKGNYSAFADKEQQTVSDFLRGALLGQNGQAAKVGSGFNYFWETGDEKNSSYGVGGVVVSDYDPRIASRPTWSVNSSTWTDADKETAAMGGKVIGSYNYFIGGSDVVYAVIPLDDFSTGGLSSSPTLSAEDADKAALTETTTLKASV